MKPYVDFQIKDKYAEIEFFHHEHNSMNLELLGKLRNTIIELSGNNNINSIILKSHGDRTFCAGANINEFKNLNDIDQSKEFFSGFGNVILAMKQSPKLIIGRIQGKAVGGGVGLLSACDIAFGTNYSSIRLSELSIGIGPFVIAEAVIRKIGLASFSDMTLNPLKWKDAEWAKNHGLFSEIYDSINTLDENLKEYIEELSSYSSEAITENKKLLWHGTENWKSLMEDRAEISGRLVLQKKIL
ncbi:MAG: enoyl-CoA hydratase/isomerase family protein [Saprospiraceae bacterium]